MPTINVRPAVLDLLLYAGDGVDFRLICTDGEGAPIDITGNVIAHIRQDRVNPDAPLAEFAVGMVDAYQGIIVLTLTGDQTQTLIDPSGKFTGVWDAQWEPSSGQPRTLCQGKVECVADVSR